MGTNLREVIEKKEISLDDLQHHVLVVDTFNMLYQFLTTIRQRDGAPLMDSHGNVTSHLVGLFSRTTKLMQKGIKLVFVFDGKPPELKQAERARRAATKKEAEKKYAAALQDQDISSMKKYAARVTTLTPAIVEESKALITALGLPVVQAPSEGEAQAAAIVKKHDAFAVVSQDYDSLLYATPRLVRNLSIAGKRKKTRGASYEVIKPEIIDFAANLNHLGIDADQLIVLAMLVGTDYNIGGVKGIGQKNALKLLKKHGNDFDALFTEVGWSDHFPMPWTDVFYLFKNMPVTDDYELAWNAPDEAAIRSLLIDAHDFSEERVRSTLEKLHEEQKKKQQKGLSEFF